jgi:hypothetical protein
MKKNQDEQYFLAHTVVKCDETVIANKEENEFCHSEIYYG